MKLLTLEELEELEAHGSHLLSDNPDTWDLLLATAKAFHTRPLPSPPTAREKALEEALREISLAGMILPLGCDESEKEKFHARRAWDFISIAAKALAHPRAQEKP